MYSILFPIYCIIAYIIGSISMANILGMREDIDLKEEGSGNLGTTNALRILGMKEGMITLCFDYLKGFLPVFILIKFFDYSPYHATIAGLCAILGHDFSIFNGFKGGKGAASTFGVLTAFNPLHGGLGSLFVLLIFISTRIMSVSVLGAALIVGFYYLYLAIKYDSINLIIVGMIILLIIRHRSNIKRIISGEEKKITIGGKR